MKADILMRLKKETKESMKAVTPAELHITDTQFSPESFFDNNQQLCILTHELEANDSNFHGHDFFEITYVLHGTCIQNFDNVETMSLSAGNVCILNPFAKHSCQIPSSEDIVINILIKPELFNSSFFTFIASDKTLGTFFTSYIVSIPREKNYLLFKNPYNAKVDELVEKIIEEYFLMHPFSDIQIRCYLILLLSELFKNTTSNIPVAEKSRVAEIMDYISNHLDSANLKSTAEHFYLHPNYLSAYVKKQTGKTFAEILSELRLIRAQYFLSNTSLPVAEISEQLGYQDPLGFHNMFKRKTEMTPAAYRELHKSRD